MSDERSVAADLAAMTPAEAAAWWLVRQDVRALEPAESRAFESWLGASAANRSAYERSVGMWKSLGPDQAQSRLADLRREALSIRPVSRTGLQVAAAAAAVVAIVGLGVLAIGQSPWTEERSEGLADSSKASTTAANASPTRYTTAHNQRSTVTLPDGTLVSLNLDTVLEVDFSSDRRQVRVTQGQAYFEVAKDALRPFAVEAAGHRIDALGTAFDVRLNPDRLEVVLVEGRVAVGRTPLPLLGSLWRGKAPVELKPGQRLIAAMGEPESITSTNAERATSWRQGWVVFEDESLEAAVAELNRYSDAPILIPDQSVRALRLSGVFRIGQPDRFGTLIQELLPVRVAHDGSKATLLLPKEPPPTSSR